MNLTETQLHEVMPSAPMEWLYVMARELPISGIDTPNEVASFVAQIAHESRELTKLEENLSYSALRMAQVWKRFAVNPEEDDLKKRTPNELATKLQHNPEGLANFVYANRNGNGDVGSGDGWLFRGRGPPQLTGRRNYTKCGLAINENLIDYPERLKTPLVGIRASLWFWRDHKMDEVDDDLDVRIDTRRLSGGAHGVAERQRYFNRCLKVLEAA